MMSKLYLCVAAGGALGSVGRFALSGWVDRNTQGGFPWGTLLVNVTGCLIIGFVASITSPTGRWPIGDAGRQFLIAGFLGGYTTFSAFSWQTLTLAQSGAWGRAAAYAGASMLFCLLAVAGGYLLARTVTA